MDDLLGFLYHRRAVPVIPLRLFTTKSHKYLCLSSKTSGDASDKISQNGPLTTENSQMTKKKTEKHCVFSMFIENAEETD